MQYRIIITLLILLLSSIASVQAVSLWIEPASVEVPANGNFTVDIMVDPEGTQIMGAEYELSFDNMILNCTEQVQGSFLTNDGASSYVIMNSFNNTLGESKYAEFRTSVNYGVTEPGVLSSISFHTIADDGNCELTFNNVVLSDQNAGEIQGVNINGASIQLISGICGDVTGNDIVDLGDVILLANHVGYYPGRPEYYLDSAQIQAGDVTGDGLVDTGDVILLSNFVGYTGYELRCN
jgi:hypothetical protein